MKRWILVPLLLSCTGYQVSPYVEFGMGRGPGFTESQWNNTGDIVDDQDSWSVMVGFRYQPPTIIAKETVLDLTRTGLTPTWRQPPERSATPTPSIPVSDSQDNQEDSDWKWLATWFAGLNAWTAFLAAVVLVLLAWIFRDKIPGLKKKNGAKPAPPAS